MKVLERFDGVTLLGGVVCYAFAFFLLVVGNWSVENSTKQTVIDIHGNEVPVPDYTEEQAHGRDVYIKNVCWHCHSQFVRPVNEEDIRFGPVSQPGESVRDVPHLYSTRRTGPDLAREGWLRVDDWHVAHFWDPRATVRDSVMPSFRWFFKDPPNAEKIRGWVAKLDSNGDGQVDATDDRTHWPKDQMATIEALLQSPDMDRRGYDAPLYNQKADGSDLWAGPDGTTPYDAHNRYTARPQGDGVLSDHDAAPELTKDGRAILEYIQQLGTAIGPWRKPEVLSAPVRGETPPMVAVEVTWTPEGGEAQTFTHPAGEMPQRHQDARRHGFHLTNATEAALADMRNKQARYEATRTAWEKANPRWARRLADGKALYAQHCAACHGDEGLGNGLGARFMRVRPRNFSHGIYRYRSTPVGSMPLDGDLYRSIFRGLPGTAMPSWKRLSTEQIWLLVDYIKSLRESQGADWDPGKPWNPVDWETPLAAVPVLKDQAQYDEAVLRGKAVFTALICNTCHGSEGRADGPGASTKSEPGQGIMRPRHFRPKETLTVADIPALRFRGGAEPKDLYRTIMNGITGVGMPTPAFSDQWKLTDTMLALQKAGAPQAEIDAAAKAARMKLNVPYKDPKMLDAGVVVAETGEDGSYAEYIPFLKRTTRKRRGWDIGDDWALVIYVRHLAGLGWPHFAK